MIVSVVAFAGQPISPAENRIVTKEMVAQPPYALGANSIIPIHYEGGEVLLETTSTLQEIEAGLTGAAVVASGTITLASGVGTATVTGLTNTAKFVVAPAGLNGSTALGELTSVASTNTITVTSRQPGTPGSTETGDTRTVNYVVFALR